MSKSLLNKKLSDFSKNIIVMFKGSAISQFIAVVGSIYLAKIYGEEAYGVFGFFFSIIGTTAIVSSLQLEKCIVTSKNYDTSKNLLNFIFLIIPFITLICALIIYSFSFFVHLEKLTKETYVLIIIGNIVMTYIIVFENFLTFQKRFSILSNIKIVTNLLGLLLQIILFYSFNVLGLVIGFIISRSIQLLFFFIDGRKNLKLIDFKLIKNELSKNKTIITYLLPSNFLNAVANNAMPLLIIYFFGIKEAGIYFFSLKILGTPLFLISSSVSQVFFQKSSELYRKDLKKMYLLTVKLVKFNLFLMLIFLVIINTVGIYILELYFKNDWQNLRIYLLIFSFLILARSSFNPISSLIVVLNKNHLGFYFNCYLLTINLFSIFLGFFYKDILITMYCLSFFGVLGYFTLLYYFLKHLNFLSKNND